MYIRPFWAGILLTLVIEIVIVMVIAYISYRPFEKEMEEKERAGHSRKPD